MALIVIPARYASTRFPGKPLVPIAGRPMLEHVWRRARESERAARVVIATDDERIADAAAEWGAEVAMTREDHPSGTDRIAEAAADSSEEIIVNLQGDEPLLPGTLIDECIAALEDDPDAVVSTPVCPIETLEDWHNPNVVKAVLDARRRALYFSRAPIPYLRDVAFEARELPVWRHIGLYCFRRIFLVQYCSMPRTGLEIAEQLEQLRILESGRRIQTVITDYRPIGVDTPQDIRTVEQRLSQGGSS